MRVVAALCWWDEPPELLYECVRAVGTALADAVVALDGAYVRYPDGTTASPPGQAEAIRDAAADAGITALVLAPDRLWAGQCEKRTYLMNAAAADADWIATVDADWIVEAERETSRTLLAASYPTAHAFTVTHVTPDGPTTPTRWARNLAGSSEAVPHVWRADCGPYRVERYHWWVSGLTGGVRSWFWGGDAAYPAAAPYPWLGEYRIVHRTLSRDELRARRNRAFCNDRVEVIARTGQEDDRPDLPRPVFDYEALRV